MPRLIRSLIILLFLPFWGFSQLGPVIYLPASPVVINFTSPGLQTWVCPANVTQIMVQCWGGGGGGGNSANNFVNGGSGGGGGVYAKTNTIFVTPGTTYYLNVGVGGNGAPGSSQSNAFPGGDSWFNSINSAPTNNFYCKARGGGAGFNNNGFFPNNGGQITNSYGDTIRAGGSGFQGNVNGGGGGGSSAGFYQNGINSININGATAPYGGGDGGNGNSSNFFNGAGFPGIIPGGGGGGTDDYSLGAGGQGANGKVRLTYYYECNSLQVPAITSNSNSGCGALSLFAPGPPQNTLGIGYQWQSSSSANGPWSNIPNANDTTLAYNCFSDTYFRLTVTCLYSNTTVTSNVIFYDFQSNPALVAPSSQNLNVTCGQNTTITSVGGSGNGYLWSPQIQDTSYQGTNQWVLNSVNNDTTVYVQTYINPPTLNSTVNITNNNQLIGFNVNNCGAGNYQGSGSVGLTWNNNLPQGSVITSCQLVLNVGIECNAGVKNTTINSQAGPSFTTTANCVCVGFTPYTLTINPALLNANGSNTFLITNANNLGLTNSMNGTNGNYAQVLISYNIGQPCVSQSAPITLTVQQPVSAGTISSSQTICAGNTPQNLSFNGLNGNIQWQYASTLVGPWTSIPGATTATLTGAQIGTLNSTTYFRVLLSNLGCTSVNSNVVTITVNPLPIVNAGVDQTICIGSQTTVSATGANSYVWACTWGSPCTIGILNSVPFTVNSAMILTVTGTDINGCTNTDQLSISTLVSATGGTSSSSITSYCVGSNAQANVTLAGHLGQIQWQYATNINGPWTNFPGATTTTLNTTTITNTIGALNTTTYIRAQLSWGNCPNAYSTVTTLTVYNFSVAGSIAASQTICSGTFPDTLILNGYVGNSFIWQVSTNGSTWTTISNSNNPFLLPTQMGSLTSNRYYRVLVTNGPCSQQVTASILITVSPNPTVGTASSSQTICIGSTQSNLSLNSWTGNIQWQSSSNLVNWSNIAGATSSSLTVAQMGGNLSTTTYYRVVVSNGAVCNPVNSNTVTITVVPQSNAGNISPNDTVCYNTQPNNIVLTNYTGTSISWQISTNGSTWNAIGTNSNILLGSQIGPITSTRYIRAYVQNSPCSGVYSLLCTLYVAPLPSVGTISSNQTICQNTTPSALVHSGNYVGNLQWQFSANNINWTNIPNQTSSILSSVAIGSLANSTYFRAMVMSEPCTPVYSNVILITVTPSSNPGTITSNQTICTSSAPANLISNNTNGVLQWQYASNIAGPWTNIAGANSSILTSGQMGALTTTRYYRLVSTNGSCPSAASNIVTITVSPQSNAGSISGPSYVCPGSSVNALQLLGNIGNVQWLVSTNINGPYTVIPNATSNSLVYGPINQSTYFQASSTSLGCATVTSSTFAVNPFNLPIINPGQNQTICIGESAMLVATGATSYVWYNQNSGLIEGSSSVVQVSPQQNTTYNVVGTDNNGCSNSSSVTVSANPLPTATLSNTGPNNVCHEEGVLLVVNGLNLTYQWNSNNNPIQGATFGSFLAQSSGNYSVTITDQTTGCSNQTNGYSVSILPEPTLSIVGDSSICQGDNATFNLGSNGQSYWEGTQLSNATVTPTTTTTYQVSAVSNQGCQTNATVTVIVHPNNDTTLWVTSYGPYSLNGIIYNTTGVYEQHVLTVHGCDSMITVNLNFLENSITELNMEYVIYPNPVLSGGHVSFSPNIPTEIPVYILSLDGKIIPTERIENIILAPLNSGVYFLVIDLTRTKFIVSD
jgi:hypothetical protein